MKKEFMRYALQDGPKSSLGKLVSGAFRKFKEWWNMYKKPVVVEEKRESTLEKLRRYRAHKNEKQEIKKITKKEQCMER